MNKFDYAIIGIISFFGSAIIYYSINECGKTIESVIGIC